MAGQTVAGPRPGSKRADWLRLRPLDGRRPLAVRLLRDPRRRDGARPAPASSSGPPRLSAHAGIGRIAEVMTRQRQELHPQPGLQGRPRRARCQAPAHQTPLPLAERQGGEPQPHSPGRVGLPARLSVQRTSGRRALASMAPALQHRAPPQRSWRSAADQPPVMNVMAEYT